MKFLSNILVKAGLVVEGSTQLNSLAGVGTRMVVANAAGVVSTQAIPVTSVFGRTGAVVAQVGDYTTAQVTESGNLYYTDARARAAISLTTTGSSGAATYTAGVLNIPNYTLAGLGGISGSGAAGQVTYWTGASAVSGSNNLFWDNALQRLSITGTNAADNTTLIVSYLNATFSINNASGTYANASLSSTNLGGSVSYGLTNNSSFTGSVILYNSNESNNLFGSLRNNSFAFLNISATKFYIGNFNASDLIFGTTNLERMRLFAGGNFSIGTPSDLGTRLGVVGDTLLRGSGATSATTALTVQNSSSQNIITIKNNRTSNIISDAGQLNIASSSDGTNGLMEFDANSSNTQTVFVQLTRGTVGFASTAINQTAVRINGGFAPTSGTATWHSLHVNPTINQQGGANGVTRGLYVNPTLTAAADWRSIEWSNNSGWGLYGAGTANSYFGGSVGIGATSLAESSLRLDKNITGATVAYGILNRGIIQPDVTSEAYYNRTFSRTAAASFALSSIYHYVAEQALIGAGSTVTNQYGFVVQSSVTGATNNYGFYGNIASGTGRWNLYMNGTADNYLAGNLGLGVMPSAWDTTYKVYEAPGNAFVAGFSGQIQIGQNAYYSGGWKYKTTAVASKYYQVNGTHVWQTAPSGIIDTSITYTQAMTLDASGNLGIGITPTVRLQVSGDTILRGSGATSATTALTVQNSGSANMLRLLNDNTLKIGSQNIDIFPTGDGSAVSNAGRGLIISTSTGTQTTGAVKIVGSSTLASGNDWSLWLSHSFAPASGTATHSGLLLNQTINQQGGANGVTCGLYVNPTLTAATDWRSIQWDNNTGYGLYGEGTAPNLIKGNLIIGPSALNQASADSSLHIGRAMNAQSSHGATIRYEAQNGVIAAHALNISLSTQDAAFTIANIYGVSVTATIKGASNTITNQYGFFVSSTFTAATNNYAYWGDIPAGANRWNLYMNGTANNYLAGSLGVGSNALTGYGFRNNKQLTGSSTSINNGAEGQIQTDVSVAAYYYRTISNQIVGTSTTSIIHYGATQGTLSGVSNNQYGFYAFDLSGSTANYGFYGALTSGANKWNLYMNGTANNYMNGALLLGNTTTDGANKLQVTGSSALNGVTYVNTNASIAGYGHSLQVLANASGGMIVSTTNSASAIGIVNSASSNKTWDISPFNNDLSFNESGVGTRMYLSAGGRIGLGIAPVTLDNATVTIGGNVTTGTGPTALLISPTVQSTATSSAVYSLVRSSTQAASFVLPSLFYYFTSEGTFGAGSSVTSQYGYYANGNMTGATNNYGFYGAIPAGTGRWNLYMNGDAHNYLAGNVGIGSGGTNDLVKLYIVGSTTGTTIYNFAYAQPQISTSLSSGLFVFRSNVSGTGTASTTESITHFIAQQSSLGSATVTNQYGFRVDTGLTGATNNYGFYGNTASGTNRWNLYMAGTASNHLNGTTLIGTATDDGVNKLQVAGSIKATGILRSDITQAAVTNNVSISLLGSNITTYAAGFSMANAGYGLNAVYAQHEQRFGGNATFAHGNINGAGLMLNKLAPTAAGTVTITQQTGQLRTMSNLHLMTQFEGNNNLTVTDMSGLHIYGHYRTSGTGTLTVSNAYYGIFLADPNEFGAGATVTGSNYGFYQQGAAPYNYFGGKVSIGTTATDGTSKLRISGLPTSATGLLAGEVWNDAGTLKIA